MKKAYKYYIPILGIYFTIKDIIGRKISMMNIHYYTTMIFHGIFLGLIFIICT
jgi:hypothetical protein